MIQIYYLYHSRKKEFIWKWRYIYDTKSSIYYNIFQNQELNYEILLN